MTTRTGRWMRAVRRHPLAAASGAASVMLAGMGVGYAVVNVSPSGGVVRACYGSMTGALRLVNSSSACRIGEQYVQWNVQGPVGLTGPAGAVGARGAQGSAGATGPQGTAGVAGAAGATGPMGLMGLMGESGAPGAMGAPGPAGEPGAIGAMGATGATGATGPAGAAGTSVVGATEPPGEHCARGGVRLESAAGVAYVCDGGDGATGAAGAAGATGAAGQSVVGASEPQGANCQYGGVRLASAGGDAYVCNGAPGAGGAAGATGPQGPAGPGGEQGIAGATGPQGAQGPAGPPGGGGGGYEWVDATTSGPFAATANTGYVANSPVPLTITLPPSATLTPGDTVRVAGGRSGWTVLTDGEQLIRGGAESRLYTWTERETARTWVNVASSEDGRFLYANYGSGAVRSSDFGLSWQRPAREAYGSLSASTFGSTLYAVERTTGTSVVLRSTDFGETWGTLGFGQSYWFSVATSGSGSCAVAIGATTLTGLRRIHVSTGGGQLSPRGPSDIWVRVATSADCSHIAATTQSGSLSTSADGGQTWIVRRTGLASSGLVSSEDGQRLVATGLDRSVHTSDDFGTTWVSHPVTGTTELLSLAMSHGVRLALTGSDYRVQTSNDFGASWTQQTPTNCSNVALSGDGRRMIAATNGSALQVGIDATQRSTTITGPASAAVELQYIGSDTFRVLSHEGTLSSY